MHILVTNDDGIHANGLLALAQAMKALGNLSILAPDRNWSASGHVKTMHRPLRVREVHLSDGTPALTTDGAPSDCVALATLGLLEQPIDLVVSGINPYANLGHDVTYSGTVTAAMEAAIAGIPGLAVSLDTPDSHIGPRDYGAAAEIAASIARRLMQRGLAKGVLINVNVPYGPRSTWNGIAVTRQGLRVYRDELVRRLDPRGREYFWIGGDPPSGLPEPGTDYWALRKKYVSVTPLHLNLTASDQLSTLESWGMEL